MAPKPRACKKTARPLDESPKPKETAPKGKRILIPASEPTARIAKKPTAKLAKKPPIKAVEVYWSPWLNTTTSNAAAKQPLKATEVDWEPKSTEAVQKRPRRKIIDIPSSKTTTTESDDLETNNGVMPQSYCESDRRIHGTYRRCGAGALYMSDKAVSPRGAEDKLGAAMSYAASMGDEPASMRARPGRITQPFSSAKKAATRRPLFDYDAVIRDEAEMVLQSLSYLYENIARPPLNMEPRLRVAGQHVHDAIQELLKFREAKTKYVNPDPSIDHRTQFEQGDGVGNWVRY